MMKRPFRTEPYHASDEEIEALKAFRAAAGSPQLPTAQQALFRIRNCALTKTPLPILEAVALGDHPDERVTRALLEYRADGRMHDDAWRVAQHKICTRILDRAKAADEGWNPGLDAAFLSTRARWQRDRQALRRARAAISMHARERLEPWVAAQADPRAAEPLLQWGFPAELAVREIRCADPQFIDAVVDTCEQEYVFHGPNHFGVDARRRVFDRLLQAAEQGDVHTVRELSHPFWNSDLFAAEPGWAEELLARSVGAVELEHVLARFVAGKQPMTTDTLRHVTAQVEAESQGFKHVDWIHLVEHPMADVDIWRRAATASGDAGVRLALAAIPEACREPEVRKNLLRSTAADVVQGLLRNARTPEEFRELFLRVCTKNPLGAVEAIETTHAAMLSALEPKDMAALLRAKDAEVRQRAILTLRRVGKREQVTQHGHAQTALRI